MSSVVFSRNKEQLLYTDQLCLPCIDLPAYIHALRVRITILLYMYENVPELANPA